MDFKEYDCGSWGWYFADDDKLSIDYKEFLEKLILISFKFGINLSAFGMEEGLDRFEDVKVIVERVIDSVDTSAGNILQKLISFNFYSRELSSRVLSSIVYSRNGEVSTQDAYRDTDSVLFSTLKDGKFYSFFYNLRTDVFIQDVDDSVYWNTARFNSYIRSMHQLMREFKSSLFDCTTVELTPLFEVSNEGYILYKKDLVFYEDVYDLIPKEMKYTFFEEVVINK